jgi:(p)ppGpp synthase/HD superfamily hydrolase
MFKHDMPWLSARTSRAAFLDVMATHFPRGEEEFKFIERAERMTYEPNKGKKRHNGEHVIWHPRGNTLILTERLGVRNHLEVVTELIHDNREDFEEEWTHELVEKEFGYTVDRWLTALTKPRKDQGLTKEEIDDLYFERFRHAINEPEPVRLKLCDVHYNGLTLDYKPLPHAGDRSRKLRDIKTHWLPVACEYNILVKELESDVRQTEQFLAAEEATTT